MVLFEFKVRTIFAFRASFNKAMLLVFLTSASTPPLVKSLTVDSLNSYVYVCFWCVCQYI